MNINGFYNAGYLHFVHLGWTVKMTSSPLLYKLPLFSVQLLFGVGSAARKSILAVFTKPFSHSKTMECLWPIGDLISEAEGITLQCSPGCSSGIA